MGKRWLTLGVWITGSLRLRFKVDLRACDWDTASCRGESYAQSWGNKCWRSLHGDIVSSRQHFRNGSQEPEARHKVHEEGGGPFHHISLVE